MSLDVWFNREVTRHSSDVKFAHDLNTVVVDAARFTGGELAGNVYVSVVQKLYLWEREHAFAELLAELLNGGAESNGQRLYVDIDGLEELVNRVRAVENDATLQQRWQDYTYFPVQDTVTVLENAIVDLRSDEQSDTAVYPQYFFDMSY